VHYFTQQEAFTLIASPKLPLAGHKTPPAGESLPEPEQSLGDTSGMILADEVCSTVPVSARDVHLALFLLLRAYDHVELRQLGVSTQVSLNHVRAIRDTLARSIKLLANPKTAMIAGQSDDAALLANCRKHHKRYQRRVKMLEPNPDMRKFGLPERQIMWSPGLGELEEHSVE
jgi:hypothetical protein